MDDQPHSRLHCLSVTPAEDQPSSEQPCLPGLWTSTVTPCPGPGLGSERLSDLPRPQKWCAHLKFSLSVPLPSFHKSHCCPGMPAVWGRGQSESDTAFREPRAGGWGGRKPTALLAGRAPRERVSKPGPLQDPGQGPLSECSRTAPLLKTCECPGSPTDCLDSAPPQH
jgi:hypothetical protein